MIEREPDPASRPVTRSGGILRLSGNDFSAYFGHTVLVRPEQSSREGQTRGRMTEAVDREPHSPLRAGAGSIGQFYELTHERRARGGLPGRGALERNAPNLLADYLLSVGNPSGTASY